MQFVVRSRYKSGNKKPLAMRSIIDARRTLWLNVNTVFLYKSIKKNHRVYINKLANALSSGLCSLYCSHDSLDEWIQLAN